MYAPDAIVLYDADRRYSLPQMELIQVVFYLIRHQKNCCTGVAAQRAR